MEYRVIQCGGLYVLIDDVNKAIKEGGLKAGYAVGLKTRARFGHRL